MGRKGQTRWRYYRGGGIEKVRASGRGRDGAEKYSSREVELAAKKQSCRKIELHGEAELNMEVKLSGEVELSREAG